MDPDRIGELELARALLAQARVDRDRLQIRVLQQDEQLRFLRRIPFITAANQLRMRRAPRRHRSQPGPKLPGTVTPGRYLDVTTLTNPARTGIARVTIRLARELGYPTVVMHDGHLVHDCTFTDEIHDRVPRTDEAERAGTALVPGPGVTVLNAAIHLGDDFGEWQAAIQALRAAGGRFVQVVHDLLPVTLPDFFDYGMRVRFPLWLAFVAHNSDLILTDSDATAQDLDRWLSDRPEAPPQVTVRTWPLGSDPLPAPRRDRPNREGPRVLVVGTIEPRKALGVVIDAVTSLRGSGLPAELVVVGHPGWADESLTRRIDQLSAESWFDWLSDADDQELADQYASCDLLVAASRGEGYGLPVAEAAAAGLPVVARDLPVFRELLGEDGRYFACDEDLADAVQRAWARRSEPTVPCETTPWSEAARVVAHALDSLERGTTS